jgi:hypothetical protein
MKVTKTGVSDLFLSSKNLPNLKVNSEKMALKKILLIGILIAIGLYFVLVLILETIRLAIGGTLLFILIYLLILSVRKKRIK